MADVLIVGDGPGGLSAALFLAKNGKTVTVFGGDKTPMHEAMLYNYLGIDEMTGSDFQAKARQQVAAHSAQIIDAEVEQVAEGETGFIVTAGGQSHTGKYLILACGPNPALAEGVGLSLNDRKMLDADRDGRTAVADCYAVGWSTRPDKIQAIISAGDGAAAALDILSIEAGKEYHDFDVVEK
jgi:thioredoxin reductase